MFSSFYWFPCLLWLWLFWLFGFLAFWLFFLFGFLALALILYGSPLGFGWPLTALISGRLDATSKQTNKSALFPSHHIRCQREGDRRIAFIWEINWQTLLLLKQIHTNTIFIPFLKCYKYKYDLDKFIMQSGQQHHIRCQRERSS